MALKRVAGQAVERLLVLLALLVGRPVGVHREEPLEFLGRVGADEEALDQHRVLVERLAPALPVHRAERLTDPCLIQRMGRGLRTELRVPAVPHDFVDIEPALLRFDQLRDHGVVAARSGRHERGHRDDRRDIGADVRIGVLLGSHDLPD